MRRRARVLLVVCLLPCFAWSASHASDRDRRRDPGARAERLERVRQLTLEQLMSIDVTSLAGVPREWFRTPAAMTVITAEELRQTGQRSLPEALRLVPGMFVGRQSSSFWRIGARGFTGAALPAPRNLVLIDGRTVYDPLWGGVYWDVQDIPLEDVDRIEVIRGPGATLWGPNAVNGVINVITKSAAESQGLLLKAGAGTFDRAVGKARFGTSLGPNRWLRTYVKYTSRDELRSAGGVDPGDDWSMLRGGVRLDVTPSASSSFVADAAVYYSADIGAVRRLPVPGAHLQFRTVSGDDEVSGGHFLARYSRELSATSSLSVQAYYDRTRRDRVGGFGVTRNTGDIDVRHDYRWIESQELIWGLGYRHTADETTPGDEIQLLPRDRAFDLFSAFVQNTSEISRDRLFAMIGSKLTHHSVTHWEAQPSARLWWTPSDDFMLWGAVSRPVRLPSRVELDGLFVLGYADSVLFSGGPPSGVYVPLGVEGTTGLESERLVAYELGGRRRLGTALTVAVSLFYDDYSRLISTDPFPLGTFNNSGTGLSRGVEVTTHWRLLPGWTANAAYSYLEVEHEGPIFRFEQDNAPKHLAHVRSVAHLTAGLQLAVAGYYVDEIALFENPARVQVDVGTIWRPSEAWELSVWGHNVTRPGIRTIGDFEYPRGVYVQGMYRR